MSFRVPEKFREKTGRMRTAVNDGCNGLFRVTSLKHPPLQCIASDGEGWEHVSVSTYGRTPTWDEMAKIKNLFWDETDCVVQFHPPKSDYVNDHPYVLHLWRKSGTNEFCERPPKWMV